MSLAFVFPGQGSQKVGMGRDLAEAFPESRAVFDEADAALGFPLSRLCFEGPEEELQLTANTQPAILAASVAALRPLAGAGRAAGLGGRATAWASTRPSWPRGRSSLGDALRTVRRRGQYMQEAVPVGVGAMAAILGLDLPAVEEACREAAEGEVVAPANVNSPGQVVIAGHAAAVDRASERCKARGAKRAVRLPVSAPFHCALMGPAQERLGARARGALAFATPRSRSCSNVDARAVRDAAACRDGLVRQVSGAVRWQESVELLWPRRGSRPSSRWDRARCWAASSRRSPGARGS